MFLHTVYQWRKTGRWDTEWADPIQIYDVAGEIPYPLDFCKQTDKWNTNTVAHPDASCNLLIT
jgi:hypothetical protein